MPVPALEVRTSAAAVTVPTLLVPFALLAALVAGRYAPLHDFDRTVSDNLNQAALNHPGWVDAMTWWSLIFHPATWRIAALVLVVWLLRRGSRALALWVTATMVAGALLGVVLKLLVGRHRPDFLAPVAEAAGYAFPSGHALTSSLGATVFLLIFLPLVRDRPLARAALWLAAITLPLVTAATRVGLGVHWVSDVLAGLFLGAALAVGTAAVFQHRSVPRGRAG